MRKHRESFQQIERIFVEEIFKNVEKIFLKALRSASIKFEKNFIKIVRTF